MSKSLSELYGFKKSGKKIGSRELKKIIIEEYKVVLREQEEASEESGFASVTVGTNIADLDTADAYKQLTSGDENAPLIQAMFKATDKKDEDGNSKTGWAPGAIKKAGGVEAIKSWAESLGESELSSRISSVSSALPGTGLPKKDMPALEGEDAPAVKDALSPGGKYNIDFEADYAGDEESLDAWISSLEKEDQERLKQGNEPAVKEESYLREEKFPAPGTIKGGGADPVGQALAFLVKGKHDGNQSDDNIDVEVSSTIANSDMVPTQSNILAGKSLLFAFLQGTGNTDLSDMGGAFVTSAGEILDGHHRWSGAYIGTGGGLNHSNVHKVGGKAANILPALTAIGNAIGRTQKESIYSQDQVIMERWNKLAGVLKD